MITFNEDEICITVYINGKKIAILNQDDIEEMALRKWMDDFDVRKNIQC